MTQLSKRNSVRDKKKTKRRGRMEDIIKTPPADDDLVLLTKPLLRPDHTPASPLQDSTASAASNIFALAAEQQQQQQREQKVSETVKSEVPTPVMLVIALCILYTTWSGIENGFSTCLFTTFQKSFNNASTVTIVTAHSCTEFAKIALAPVVGHFANRAKPLAICFGSVIWMLGSWLLGGADSVSMLFAGFSVIGAGFAFLTVLTPPILEDYAERQKISMLLGFIYACAPLGVAVFYVICGLVAENDGWRLIFAVVAPAMTMLPLVILSCTVMRDMCCNCSGGGRGGTVRASSAAAAALASIAEPDLPFWSTLKGFLNCSHRSRTIILLVFMLSSQAFYISAMIALLPKYLESRSDKATAAIVLASTIPAALLSTAIGGWIVRRYSAYYTLKRQISFCFWTHFATLPPIAIVFATADGVPFTVAACLLPISMFCSFLNAAPSISMLALLCKTKREVARLQSLMNVVSRTLGAIPGPIVLSALIDASDHVDPTSPLMFSHCFLIVGLFGGVLTCSCCAAAYFTSPDVAVGGNFEDDGVATTTSPTTTTTTNPTSNISNHNHAAGATVDVEEMGLRVTDSPQIDSSISSNGGALFPPPSASSSLLSSHRAGGRTVVLPRISIIQPSRSPDRTSQTLSAAEQTANEWKTSNGGLLARPESECFFL